MIRLDNISKSFLSPTKVEVLKNISMTIDKGQWISLMGPSGSGKSTLLSLISGLDLPTEGEIEFEGQQFTQLSEERRAQLRAEKMGFIFQSFRLIPHLNIEENIALPLQIIGNTGPKTQERVASLIEEVGLSHRKKHYPSQLSGGEQQRVAIARAFVTKPSLLLADEPTGNLDEEKGLIILDMLSKLQEQSGTTLFVVSHDPNVAKRADKQFLLKNGQIVEDN